MPPDRRQRERESCASGLAAERGGSVIGRATCHRRRSNAALEDRRVHGDARADAVPDVKPGGVESLHARFQRGP
jgi:hypothetical protein